MSIFPPTFVIRHRQENLKKCSLHGLEERPDFVFLTYPYRDLPDLTGYVVLMLNAPPLTLEEASRGIILLDATWRYAKKMIQPFLHQDHRYIYRSLPSHYKTAYPRRQEDCSDPERGLASVEAIYLSYHIL